MAVAMLCLQSSVALAIPNPDTGPGCGLGKTLWSDSMNQKNILPQAFMATTNITGFQTFAISSGTSGCSNDGVLWADHKVHAFIVANSDDLAQEMAQGRGEHLASLAVLMGVQPEHHAEFFAIAQREYRTVTPDGGRSSLAIIDILDKEIGQDPILAHLAFSGE
jgi:hypothetical protein